VDAWLLRACAKLGIKLVHSQPRRPGGKGKIERFSRTVRDGFLVELTEERAARIPDLAELNKLFTAWTETVCHVREHSGTGQPPLARREAGGPFPLPAQADLAEAFRWPAWRTVSKTALVSLHGNQYQVGPALARRRVELVFDPFDLTVLFVRRDGKDAGTATPHHITRHSHPKARPEDPVGGDEAPRATGVDYIALIGEQHDRQQKEGPVNYRALMPPAGGHGGAPASGQPGREQGQGQGGLGAGEEDGRG
jgi:putative transposase